MTQFFKDAWLAISTFLLLVIAFAGMGIGLIALMAIPFIAIGGGLGFIGWTFCLFVGFC